MKYLSVSNGLPGPIIASHQPGRDLRHGRSSSSAAAHQPAACASPERACVIRMALSRAGESSP
ncbi:MAG: hypothetical protein M5R36_15965 [Deltaproteobacteria bacterium]|nr:hypothetical protein [Deltaproteobacteria bacterium]